MARKETGKFRMEKGLWDREEPEEEPSGRIPSGKVNQGLLDIPSEAPLALRMAPRSFSEFLGQEDILGPGKALRTAIERGHLFSMLFYGPPGTGKTALARLIALSTKCNFEELSAVTSGVQDVRDIVARAEKARISGQRTILFIDEIHRFTKTQQDALLPHVERGTVTLIGATTENPYFAVNSALLSRMRVFTFQRLRDRDIFTILERAINDKQRGLSAGKDEEIVVEKDVLEHIVSFAKGDARIALNVLEAVYNGSLPEGNRRVLTLQKALEITQTPSLFYDKSGDQHYDIISAYIKSMRGSDPDAALYWLARMLESGEDPRYVARRMVILASEDVGNADPFALVLAEAAFRAVEHLGMPEARIPLAQATIYLALAPKSNASYLAIEKAMEDVRQKPSYPVPEHLRGSASFRDKTSTQHYLYPHDYPGHYVKQQYLPTELLNSVYYEPSPNEKVPPKKEK